ncbi:MAG: TIGR00366 family protein [Phycisphaerales bacterium]|nr:TIGR00366 family protein [Phycisphaerales bacterium]
MRRLIPDPFVIAIVLTLFTMVAVLIWGTLPEDQSRFTGMIRAWSSGDGMWKLLGFAMQMSLILLGGHVLAETTLVQRALYGCAKLPQSSVAAASMVAFVAAVLGVLNWGLGLVGGALLARATGRAMEQRGIRVHYPLLAAAGYMGLLVWHGGFSGSAPLAMTTRAGAEKVLPSDLVEQVGAVGLESTVLSELNLVVTGGLLVLLPVLLGLLGSRTDSVVQASEVLGPESDEIAQGPEIDTFTDRLLHGWWLGGTLGVLLLIAAVISIGDSGIGRLGLNQVITLLLGFGLVLHRSPARFADAATQAAAGCAGIIVQFPLYAGIMGLLISSGLAADMTRALVESASGALLPVATFLSAGVVNMLVPSGGGQWAVQGPIALQAGLDAGVAPATMLMSVAYGDELTNMLQPFWALPLLAITGVRARDIFGYTFIAMCLAGGWMILWLVVFA